MFGFKENILEEISKAHLTINDLRAFKNKKSLMVRTGSITFEIFYRKVDFRYYYKFFTFTVENEGIDFKRKKYRSINRLLKDLKDYIKYLQRTYSEYKKSENS